MTLEKQFCLKTVTMCPLGPVDWGIEPHQFDIWGVPELFYEITAVLFGCGYYF